MRSGDYTWVQTYKQIADYLLSKENKQADLVALLKSVGIGPFNDQSKPGDFDIQLDEIDPFTFFCYLNKYKKPTNNLKNLRIVAEKLGFELPTGLDGLPSIQSLAVWMFGYKYQRVNNEIPRLWSLFKKALDDSITDDDFADALEIKGTGIVKITEVLFYVRPDKYFPIDGPTKPYLKEVLNIDPKFKTYSEYLEILNQIRGKSPKSFFELSHDAYLWNNQKSDVRYWHYSPGENAKFWDEFYENGIMAIGWDEIGDLSQFNSKDEVDRQYLSTYGNDVASNMNSKLALYEFSKVMKQGDIIIVKRGKFELLGYGKITSEYIYQESRKEFKHVRGVDWLNRGTWKVGFTWSLKH